MNFEWDEEKNQANRRKHGLDFADASLVFAAETLTFEDCGTRLTSLPI